MRRKWWLSVAAAAALTLGGSAAASAQQTTYSLSDVEVQPASALLGGGEVAGVGKAACGGCGADLSACGCGLNARFCDDEPWSLFGTSCRGITAGGWINGGITWNDNGNSNNFPTEFNAPGKQFLLNQLWGFVAKETDTGGYGVDWGFRVDYLFGTDAANTQAFGDFGWDYGWNTSSQYGSAIPQLYFEVAFNNLTVKVGHFFTIIGYEVVAAPDNFFYSHALTMNYGEPFTHTGVLASYQMGDLATAYFGWTTGWDGGFGNKNDASTFLGGLSVELTDRATLAWACVAGNYGDGTANPLNVGDIYMNSIVLQYQLTEQMKYVFQHDLGVNTNHPVQDNEWYGINQYLFYDINQCWSVGGRFEWFRDDDGSRIGTAGHYYEGTLGLNWKPTANINVRPEVRFDWFDGQGTPFNNGTEDSLTTFGFDAIFTF